MACIEAIKRLGKPLDAIITCDVYATDSISANLPDVEKFKEYADKEILRRYGIRVTHIRGESFEQRFYTEKIRGKYMGKIYGFPTEGKVGWCMKYLKLVPFEEYFKTIPGEVVRYLGIASDELQRVQDIEGYQYPLVEIGWSEQDCYDWCEEHNLLSPTYTHSFRDGCWFCPKQPLGELRRIWRDYPDYWAMMLKWDMDSPVSWDAEGRSLHDYDRRFRCESKRLIPSGPSFRWQMLDCVDEQTNQTTLSDFGE